MGEATIGSTETMVYCGGVFSALYTRTCCNFLTSAGDYFERLFGLATLEVFVYNKKIRLVFEYCQFTGQLSSV